MAERPPVPMKIAVCGAGPVGLAFAISTAERAKACGCALQIVVFELRIERHEEKWRWQRFREIGCSTSVENRRREQVVTLQDSTLMLFDGLSRETRQALLGDGSSERVWLSSENVAIRDLEDALLARAQSQEIAEIVEIRQYPQHIATELRNRSGGSFPYGLSEYLRSVNVDLAGA